MVQLLKDGDQREEALEGDVLECCTVFEVPAHLRALSPARYQSKVLELGLHRRTLQKSHTEVFKFELIRIVHSKLTTKNSSWDCFASDVVGDVNKARRAYLTSSERFTDEEVRSLLASDALFLVVLFKYVNGRGFFWKEFEAIAASLREILALMLKSDFFLIENQVPMYLLQSAIRELCNYDEETQVRTANDPTFKIEEMVEDELEKVLNEAVLHLSPFTFPDIPDNRIPRAAENSRGRLYKHLLKTYPVVPLERSLITCRHLLDCLHTVICGHLLPFKVDLGVRSNLALENIPSATRLRAVGIRILGTAPTVSDINLSGKGYVRSAKLHMPKVELYDYTELAFHNLALHEQKISGGLCGDFRCYVQCMASLCVNMSDVQLLSEQGVINNHMGHDCISGMWDRALRGVLTPNPSSKWVECYSRIHQHRKASLKRWRQECWTLFFSKPWTLVSVIGAFIVLFLLAVLTWFTAFPPKGSNNGSKG